MINLFIYKINKIKFSTKMYKTVCINRILSNLNIVKKRRKYVTFMVSYDS